MSKAYILIVCLIFSFSILSEGKEIPVNGDKSILDLLSDAQEANRDSLHQGHWLGTVRSGNLDISWFDQSRRIEFNIDNELFSIRHRTGIAVRNRHRQAIYFDKLQSAISYDGIAKSFPEPADFFPPDWWFSFHGGRIYDS